MDIPIETRNLAALLASKVYYFLGEYDEALAFALGAGSAFQVEFASPEFQEYIETITCDHSCPLFLLELIVISSSKGDRWLHCSSLRSKRRESRPSSPEHY